MRTDVEVGIWWVWCQSWIANFVCMKAENELTAYTSGRNHKWYLLQVLMILVSRYSESILICYFFFFVTSEMYTEGVIIHISYYTVPLSFNSFTMLQMSCGWYINQNVKIKWKDYVLFLMVGRGRDPFDIINFRYPWKYLLACLCISSWKFLVGICTK